MWFGEPHPFPERGSPNRLSASGQQNYKGWSCRDLSNVFQQRANIRKKEIKFNIQKIFFKQVKCFVNFGPRDKFLRRAPWRQTSNCEAETQFVTQKYAWKLLTYYCRSVWSTCCWLEAEKTYAVWVKNQNNSAVMWGDNRSTLCGNVCLQNWS